MSFEFFVGLSALIFYLSNLPLVMGGQLTKFVEMLQFDMKRNNLIKIKYKLTSKNKYTETETAVNNLCCS